MMDEFPIEKGYFWWFPIEMLVSFLGGVFQSKYNPPKKNVREMGETWVAVNDDIVSFFPQTDK